eukprot:CAMPEP_0202787758 /NCGR_PEP_ID=MMETSP1388-20130828/73178_1 /ASSEMBLY_ACC=CAM_ASM_000864 /TAXON_ID=37098 /ORGANISM="Isochrysis sp, Strain CCMP1244" /LENGTH=154 /DNA_ID=CAMNT_0049457363 /DNA_START=570 /DNA_END=1030 /DNA_ORIENTATION=+
MSSSRVVHASAFGFAACGVESSVDNAARRSRLGFIGDLPGESGCSKGGGGRARGSATLIQSRCRTVGPTASSRRGDSTIAAVLPVDKVAPINFARLVSTANRAASASATAATDLTASRNATIVALSSPTLEPGAFQDGATTRASDLLLSSLSAA